MAQFVEVRFKGNRKAYFEWHEPEPLRLQEPVIVEAERGVDYGLVNAIGAVAQTKCDRCTGCAVSEGKERGAGRERGEEPAARRQPEPTRRIVRRAAPADRKSAEELRRTEDDVRRKVREKVQAHGLQMKVSDAEWQWDRNKLTVYFTAERRVDFRALVRELASQFRTRIELRQIGVRDEAARLSGIGRCGREYCSASWLPELRPIGLHVAKDQRLSLNPTQISGPCGRLLCCLRFEHEFYVQSRKRFPKEGKVLQTAVGAEKVVSIDIFRDRVTLRGEGGAARTVALADLKREVETAQGPLATGTAPAAPTPPATPAAQDGALRSTSRRPEGRPRSKPGPERPPRPGASAPAPAGTAPQGGATDAEGRPDDQRPDERGQDGPRRRRRRRGRRRGPGGPGTPGGPPTPPDGA